MFQDLCQHFLALCHQVFIAQGKDFRRVQPAHKRCKARSNIRQEFFFFWIQYGWKNETGGGKLRFAEAGNAGAQPGIEIGQRLGVILVMDMAGFHICHVMHMRNRHIARIAQDKIARKPAFAEYFDYPRQCMYMTISNIAG